MEHNGKESRADRQSSPENSQSFVSHKSGIRNSFRTKSGDLEISFNSRVGRKPGTPDSGFGRQSSNSRKKSAQSQGSFNGIKSVDPTSAPGSIGELLGISRPTVHQNVMIAIIEDPIQCGYLLTFCESEHSTENLTFVMEVIRFREVLSCDKITWTKSWQAIDAEMGLSSTTDQSDGSMSGQPSPIKLSTTAEASDEPTTSAATTLNATMGPWPSKRLELRSVQELTNSIWDRFMADHSPTQICIPSKVVCNTLFRMQRMDLYGPEIFGEALLDPIKTLQRDTLPRFLNSPLCADMVCQMDSLRSLPPAHMLSVPGPPTSIVSQCPADTLNDKRLFTLEEILTDKTLYADFLSYLTRAIQVENLLCIRMIEIFEEMVVMAMPAPSSSSSTSAKAGSSSKLLPSPAATDAIKAHAWTIYRYFVAPCASLEVSLYSRHKKELMIGLANPKSGLFIELEKSARSMLSVSFNTYRFTEDYRNLYKLMREEKKKGMSMSAKLSLSNLLWK